MTQLKNLPDRLALPWPPKELSPNYSGHWAPQASAKKKYRFAVRMLATQAKWEMPEDGKIYLEVEFYPPDRRPRDKDNMIGAFKAGQDGYPSAGLIAWLLWGGDSGKAWADAKWAAIKRARGEA